MKNAIFACHGTSDRTLRLTAKHDRSCQDCIQHRKRHGAQLPRSASVHGRSCAAPGVWSLLAGLVLLVALPVAAQVPTDNPVATFYSAEEGWPAWTANIRWDNVFNITSYGGGTNQSGTANFNAFEAARDAAYAAGGGVVYFPAGTYDITLPDAGAGQGCGPNSRGLMLRSGVVLRGATPTGDLWARSNALYTADGEFDPPTKLRFAKRTRYDEDNIARQIPSDWSFIGLKPEPGQGVKDVHNVGVVWMELQNATIYWGPQYSWTATWNDSSAYLAQKTKTNWPTGTPWSSRAPDGTHPGDPFCGAASTAYQGGGRGRLVFGVKIVDGCVVNDFYWAAGRGVNGKLSAFAPFRFCGRIAAYGSDVFVANNVLAMPTNNFVYKQWTKNAANVITNRTVLWDSANTIGIDVNKSLNGWAKPTTPGTGYYHTNVVVRDNWVFNRGNKGADVSGQYAVLQNNHNHRYYLGYIMPPAPYPNPGSSITAMLDGWIVQDPSDGEKSNDFMSRGYDLAGRNLWADQCVLVNAGSVGNDGEGVMSQRSNNIDVYSWAFTDCRQYTANFGSGTIGEVGWIGAYGQNVYGFLLLRNINDGWVGHGGPTNQNWWMLDMTCVLNRNNSGGAATIYSNHSGVLLPKDFTAVAHSNAVAVPTGVTVTVLPDQTGVQLDWSDNATNELGYRLERRISGGSWRTIAYRPAINLSKTVSGTDAFSTVPINQINNPHWCDFLAPRGQWLEYRVVAINALDDATYASSASSAVMLGGLTYAAWIAGYPGVGSQTAPTDDPDGDGLANLAEFAFGYSPVAPNTSPAAQAEADHLTLTYTRRLNADVTVFAEASGSVTGGWSTAGITNVVLGSDGIIQTNKAIDGATISGSTSRFMRLRVTQP